MKKKVTVTYKTVITAVIAAVMLTFAITYYFITLVYYKKYKNYSLLAEAHAYVDKYYYGDEVEESSLTESTLGGYISGLNDVYSCYNGIQKTQERTDNYAGLKAGIGITVSEADDGYLLVDEVSEDSTAQQAGISAGDIIISIDGKDTKELGMSGAVQLISEGKIDSQIVLKIKRDNEVSDYSVKIGKIDIVSVYGKLVEKNIGYIYITKFNEKTSEQFIELLNSLKNEGAEGYIFDVRDNGGGLVSAVEKCLDPLLPEGEIAVAIYKDGKSQTIVQSDATETDMPMTVLMNENSASGAELFAASLHDFKDVDLVGKKSFGKGIMQNLFTLSDGSTITLTVARYKTTRSECYHGIGLKPDYEVEYDNDQESDKQFDKAVEVLRQKLIK